MGSTNPHDITNTLNELKAGDESAYERLLSVVYEELRVLASSYIKRQDPGHTLQPTALVHEAYMKLVQQENPSYHNRVHFFAVAAKAMRQLLIDHARKKNAAKRGEGWERVTLSGVYDHKTHDIDVLDLDEALNELATLDEQQARIVELRFFGGLTIDETSEELGISTSTIEREWRAARAWLSGRLTRNDET
ncbi:MAG: sigma-70 family RNA polymerase sigma factor [Planctomycetota bacterium]|nr:sigma-70 family RNA polymerase sigma factor [Planctomycetota bacterium]